MPSQEPRVRLEKTLSAAEGKPLVVLISGHPDPDAIGSALAHQRICETFGIPTSIAHVLPVSRAENRALVKLLNVSMVKIGDPRELEAFSYLSLVDSTTSEATIEVPGHLELLTVVDHHRNAAPVHAAFVDVRPQVGATATIYAEYIESGLAPFNGAELDSRVATALLFGIQTDTDDFALATPSDFRAAAFLKPFCDHSLLGRIGHRTMTAETMDAIARALADLEVVRDFALAGVGAVAPTSRDAMSTAADFIIRRNDIDTVLVYGIVDNRIDGSLRTKSASVDPAQFLVAAFGHDPSGRPYGGGRADKGGFQVPIGLLGDCDDAHSLWAVVKRSVRARLAKVVPDLARAGGAA